MKFTEKFLGTYVTFDESESHLFYPSSFKEAVKLWIFDSAVVLFLLFVVMPFIDWLLD